MDHPTLVHRSRRILVGRTQRTGFASRTCSTGNFKKKLSNGSNNSRPIVRSNFRPVGYSTLILRKAPMVPSSCVQWAAGNDLTQLGRIRCSLYPRNGDSHSNLDTSNRPLKYSEVSHLTGAIVIKFGTTLSDRRVKCVLLSIRHGPYSLRVDHV